MQFLTSNTTIFIILTLTLCKTSFGQPERLINRKISEIKKAGVDTIITFYEFEGRPSYRIKDKYVIGASIYIFWKENSSYLAIKASDYYDTLAINVYDTLFRVVRLDNLEAYKYLADNLDIISKQELKVGLIKDQINGKDSLIEVKYSDESIVIIEVYIGRRKFEKRIRSSQLDNGVILNLDGSLRFKRKSINYDYNINSSVYKLYALLNAAVADLESKGAFHD